MQVLHGSRRLAYSLAMSCIYLQFDKGRYTDRASTYISLALHLTVFVLSFASRLFRVPFYCARPAGPSGGSGGGVVVLNTSTGRCKAGGENRPN